MSAKDGTPVGAAGQVAAPPPRATPHFTPHFTLHFTLYSRSYCHLCEDMLQALLALQRPGERFEVAVVDVDADPALVARFDELVPVLFGDPAQPELCHYFLDADAVRAWIDAQVPTPA